jgi:hypothetical protein
VFNATFNNISDKTWRSLLLVEKTINLPQVKLYHNQVSQKRFEDTEGVIRSCKSKWKRQYNGLKKKM